MAQTCAEHPSEAASTSGQAFGRLPSWNIVGWVLRGRQGQPPPALPPAASAQVGHCRTCVQTSCCRIPVEAQLRMPHAVERPIDHSCCSTPCLQVAASAAAEAAAALAAWEQAEGQPPGGGYGYAPAEQQQQQQQLEYEEEYFEEEEEEEEGFYDPYRPFKLLLAGGAPEGVPSRFMYGSCALTLLQMLGFARHACKTGSRAVHELGHWVCASPHEASLACCG